MMWPQFKRCNCLFNCDCVSNITELQVSLILFENSPVNWQRIFHHEQKQFHEEKKPNSYYWFCKADIFNFSSECLVYCVLVQTAASRKTATDKYTEKDRHSHNNMRNKCEWLINWMKLRKVYATSADNNKREKIDDFILNPPKSLHTHFNFNFNSNNSIISFEYRKYALIIILVLYFLCLNFDGDFKITIDNWTTNEIKNRFKLNWVNDLC